MKVKPLTRKETDVITHSEFKRMQDAMNGKTVVSNMRKGADTTLIKWAKKNRIFIRIDRKTLFGNPFKIGGRSKMITDYEEFIEHLTGQICGGCCGGTIPELLRKISAIKPGSVLGCWCYPLSCHGGVIAKIVNDHYCKHTPLVMPVRKPQQLSLF